MAFFSSRQSIVEPYCSNYQPRSIELDLPITLTTLVDEKAQAMNFNELIKFCESIDISVSENQVKVAEQEARDQANSQLWFNMRSGRITASENKISFQHR